MANQSHSPGEYRLGCRCKDCRAAQSAYQADYRKRRREGAPVRQLKPELDEQPAGRVELGVLAEVSRSVQAGERPGLVEVALALARILDNRRALGPQPAAASKLQSILGELRQGGGVSRSRLAAVRSMTSAKSAS